MAHFAGDRSSCGASYLAGDLRRDDSRRRISHLDGALLGKRQFVPKGLSIGHLTAHAALRPGNLDAK
jgi:hypothetical protein